MTALSHEEAAARLGVSRATLREMMAVTPPEEAPWAEVGTG